MPWTLCLRTRHAQQSPTSRVVVAGRPDHAERQDLPRELPIHNAPELRADGCLARQSQASPKGNQRQKVVAADLLELDVGMAPEIGEMRDQVIVNLRARWRVTDNEGLTGDVRPRQVGLGCEGVAFGQDDKDMLEPELLCFASVPRTCSGDEGRVQFEVAHSSDMFGRVAVDQMDANLGVLSSKGAQQVEQETGSERGEDAELEDPFLRPSDRGNARDADVNLTQGMTGTRHELLPCDSQADAAVRSLEQRGAKIILEISDAPADRGFLNGQSCGRLAEAPVIGGGKEVSELPEPDGCSSPARRGKPRLGGVTRTALTVPVPSHVGSSRATTGDQTTRHQGDPMILRVQQGTVCHLAQVDPVCSHHPPHPLKVNVAQL